MLRVATLRALFLLACALATLASPASARPGASGLPPVPIHATERGSLGIRQPALLPDGSALIFVAGGDLWTVAIEGGTAVPVLRSPADEQRPVVSPRGTWLAYAARVGDNYDVFVRPMAGGESRRLTFDPADDWPSGFAPDESRVLFHSRRHRDEAWIYEVAVTGGEPEALTRFDSQWGVLSPDGRSLAFVQGGEPWWRKGYRGAAGNDVAVMDLESGEVRRVAATEASESWPLFLRDSKRLLVVSDRAVVANLYEIDATRDRLRQLSLHRTDAVRWPSVALAGATPRVAYEQDGSLWTIELSDPLPAAREIPIQVPLETESPVSLSLGPTSIERLMAWPGSSSAPERLLVLARGELFSFDPVNGGARNLSQTMTRERDPAPLRDGRSLLCASDAAGRFEIVRLTESPTLDASGAWESTVFRGAFEDKIAPVLSTDEQYVAYVVRKGGEELHLAELNGGRDRRIDRGVDFGGYAFSPDSRWLVYSKADAAGRHELHLLWLLGSDAQQLTLDSYDDRDPLWTAERIVFRSDRAGSFDLWAIDLTEAARVAAELARVQAGRVEPKPASGAGSELGLVVRSASKSAVTLIEPEGLGSRLRQLTALSGDEDAPRVGPNDNLFFVGPSERGRDLFSIRDDGAKLQRWTESGEARGDPSILDSRRELYWLELDGTIGRSGYALDRDQDPVPSSSSGSTALAVQFSGVIPGYRAGAERLQMLREAWRTLRDRFYDPGLHLAPWDELLPRYEARLPARSNPEGMRDLLNELAGELDASHVGARLETSERSEWLGLEVSPAGAPGPEVRLVWPGGPASRVATDAGVASLLPGDRVIEVNGQLLEGEVTLERALAERPSSPASIRWRDASGKVRSGSTVPLRPSEGLALEVAADASRRARWVEARSKGQVGYLSLPRMDRFALDRMERDLYVMHDRVRGYVLDLRGNPGGSGHERALDLLLRTPWVSTRARGGDWLPVPRASRDVPLAVLVDAGTRSDAEVLAAALKESGAALLVGTPTYGGVVGAEDLRLVDGTLWRVPRVGWGTRRGQNLENLGVKPDVMVSPGLPGGREADDPMMVRALERLGASK